MTVSRNGPCPCGSGKKYKQCCGRNVAAGFDVVGTLRQAWQFHQAGLLQQAEGLYRRILAAQPDNADALHLLGLIAQGAGQLEAARELLEKAVRAKPGEAMFRHNLATLLYGQGKLKEAEAHAARAVQLQPGLAEARQLLGTVYKAQGRFAEAIQSFEAVLRLHPDHVAALNNLGVALIDAEQAELALAPLSRLLELVPGMAEGMFSLGSALKALGRFGEAERRFSAVLDLQPEHEGALQNFADMLQIKGDFEHARPVYLKLVNQYPGSALGHLGLATCLLALGELENGWREYHWRMERVFAGGVTKKRPFVQPWWQGEALAGKTLLVWGEQGVGDEILFASLVGDALARGARVILECEPRLAELFARSFPTVEICPRTGLVPDPPPARLLQTDIDYQIPSGSLARWLRPTPESFPAHQGYLAPAPERIAYWKGWLASLGPGPKVGISWRSLMRDGVRNAFYTELAQWGEILRTPGVVFVNLQYGDCREELEEAHRLFGVEIRQAPGLNLKDQLDDAAALTRALDLAIAPNTSVFAMAGAVGTPTWMLNLDSDWTMLGSDGMPWFPSVRVYRKGLNEAWEVLLAQVAGALGAMTKKGEA